MLCETVHITNDEASNAGRVPSWFLFSFMEPMMV